MPEATNEANEQRLREVLSITRSKLPAGGAVAVLGLAYKPETNVVEQSAGLALARGLAQAGPPVVGYDPVAGEAAREELEGRVTVTETLDECVSQADVIIVAVPWAEFATLGERLPRDGRPRVVIDCWRILDPATFATSADYVPLGVGPKPAIPDVGRAEVPPSAPTSFSEAAEPALED